MCTFQTLYYHNDHGYVVKCCECNNIQIGFGNVLLTFHASEFNSFRYWLKAMEIDPQPAPDAPASHAKSITVPTPCEGLKLLFSPLELCTFNHMLDAADTEIQSQAMMQLFNA